MYNNCISVIVPVYNLSEYIIECLNSIWIQNIDFNIEIIIVNDGSTDNSEDKIIKFKQEVKDEKNNKRIIVINQKNLGISEARNTGIKNATGEYLLFIDGDDYIENDMLADLYEIAKNKNADIVVSSYSTFQDGQKNKEEFLKSSGIEVYSPVKAVQAFVRDELRGYVCGNLYKRELFNDIRFESGVYFEDMFPNLKLYYKANKVVKMETKYYQYRQGRENAITTGMNEKKFIDSTIQIINCYNFIKNIPEEWAADYSFYYKVNKLIYKWPFYCQFLNYSRKDIYKLNSTLLGNLPEEINTLSLLKSPIIPKNLKIRYLLYKLRVYDLYFKYKN